MPRDAKPLKYPEPLTATIQINGQPVTVTGTMSTSDGKDIYCKWHTATTPDGKQVDNLPAFLETHKHLIEAETNSNKGNARAGDLHVQHAMVALLARYELLKQGWPRSHVPMNRAQRRRHHRNAT